MDPRVEAMVKSEERRHVQAIATLMQRYPEYRSHLAYALLGSAVAVCDSLGIDPIAFIRGLRDTEPLPPVLVPPKARQS